MLRLSLIRSLPLIAATMAMFVHPAAAHEYKAGDLTIENPWTRATPAGAKTAAGYARITNNGEAADRLVGGSAAGAERVEVHEMKMDNNVMRMRELEQGLEIKPGETVELKPGSYHLMMIGLNEGYKEGQTVEGTVTFKNAGTVNVAFPVLAIGETMDHAGHDHSHGKHDKMKEGHDGGQ